MDAPLAARIDVVLEVLDGVGEVGGLQRDPGVCEGSSQEASGRPGERLAAAVLDVPRLLADEDHRRRRRTAGEDHLRRVAVEIAALASPRGGAELLKIAIGGHESRGARRRDPGPHGLMASRPARLAHDSAGEMLTIHRTPNLSTHMPNVSPHGDSLKGMRRCHYRELVPVAP
jgi:hypothetical protein